MPLSKIQSDILRLLASHRDPESYVAGSTPLKAAEQDGAFLQERGYALRWLRRDPLIYTVLAERGGEATKLEWVVDSDFRFFPTVRDEVFGYVLLLFVKDGQVTQPDPARLQDYQTHAGQRRGQWPTSVEISTAMVERYKNLPKP